MLDNLTLSPPALTHHAAGDSKGKGAFAAENTLAHTLIGEYAGKVAQADAALGEDQVLRRGYAFSLKCCGLVVDASEQGNLTRFINHAAPPRSNVYASLMVLEGLRKVVLRAGRRLRQGEELLLNYGFTEDGWV